MPLLQQVFISLYERCLFLGIELARHRWWQSSCRRRARPVRWRVVPDDARPIRRAPVRSGPCVIRGRESQSGSCGSVASDPESLARRKFGFSGVRGIFIKPVVPLLDFLRQEFLLHIDSRAFRQGNRSKNSACVLQDGMEIAWVPSGRFAAELEALGWLGRAQQVHRHMPEDGHIVGPVVGA